MIILDTDHLVALKDSRGPDFATLANRMAGSTDQEFVTTAVTVEEQLRGWLALINRSNDVHRHVQPYGKLVGLIDFFSRWDVLPFDNAAADQFKELRRQKVRIGTMDLKIASIALATGARVLTANLRVWQADRKAGIA